MGKELIFEVEEEDGGYIAAALGESIFTEADTLEELRANVLDAVKCHFHDTPDAPRVIAGEFGEGDTVVVDEPE